MSTLLKLNSHPIQKIRLIIQDVMVQVGNAAIGDETDNQGMYDFFGTHALISYENLRKIRRYCDFSRAHESAECHHHSLFLDGNLTSRPRKTSVSKNKFFSTNRKKKKCMNNNNTSFQLSLIFWANYFCFVAKLGVNIIIILSSMELKLGDFSDDLET